MNIDTAITLADAMKLVFIAGGAGILIAQLRGVRDDTKEIRSKQDMHGERVSAHETRLAVLEAREDVGDKIVEGLQRMSRSGSSPGGGE